MHEKTKKLSMRSSVLWNTAGSFFYYFCQWLMTVLVVRLSGVDDAGLLTLCISVSNIWISLSSFGMHNYQASDTENKYTFGTYLVSRYVTGAMALLGCIAYLLLLRYSPVTDVAVVFYFLYRFSESLEDVYYAAFQKAWHIDIAGKSMLIRGLLSIGLFSAVLVGSGNLSLTIVVLAAACLLVVYLYDGRKGRMFTNRQTDNTSVRALLLECLPLAVYTLLNTFVPMAPRLVMERVLGNYELGVYGSIATPTVVVQMIATYVFNPFITLFAEELAGRDIRGFVKSLRSCLLWLFGISVFSVAVGLFFGHWGLNLLYGSEIAGYTALLTPLIIASALIAFMWLLGGTLVAARSFRWLLASNILSSAAILPLSFFFEEKWGMQGASLATIVSVGLAIVILVAGLFREIKKKGE